MSEAGAGTAAGACSAPSSRPVWIAWLLLVALASAPFVKATMFPPPGRAFTGTFHWTDDVYYYLSFAQQAEDGRFVLVDKLRLSPHAPALINLEWWLTGTVSRLIGRRPALAFRLVGTLAALALLAGVDRWLVRAGLPPGHRLAALLLVGTGGGLSGLLFELTTLPIARCLDLSVGLQPFLGLLAQPHWTCGTALLLWSLWFQAEGTGWRGTLAAGIAGTALALVRPYDLALMVGTRLVVVHLFEAKHTWPASWLRLATVLPAFGYVGWLFFLNPDFAAFSSRNFAATHLRLGDLAASLGPPAVIAAIAFRPGCWGPTTRHLQVWIAAAALLVGTRLIATSNQFAVGWGLPILALLALTLARFRPLVTFVAAIALSSSAVTAFRIVWNDEPGWQVPAERWQAALALRPSCRDGGVLMSPPDVGLYTIGLTGCRAWVAHHATPGYEERLRAVAEFYGPRTPVERAAFADRACLTHLALPGGGDAQSWLGAGAAFRTVAVAGTGPSAILLAARPRPPHCPAP